MLAQAADDVGDALTRLGQGEAAFEYKLDGARIQVHKARDEVRVFSRQVNDVTRAVPEGVEAVRRLPLDDAILDGEAIALRPDGTPLPFQVTMRRFGRKLDVERLRAELPLVPFFFDILYADGAPLLDEPYALRFAVLAAVVPGEQRVPRIVTSDAGEAGAFFERAIAAGHEGLMAKALDARYDAGARGAAWLKLKPAHTLDLVVLAAEWGHGRRRGRLSNLHLGARDARAGGGGRLQRHPGEPDVAGRPGAALRAHRALPPGQGLGPVGYHRDRPGAASARGGRDVDAAPGRSRWYPTGPSPCPGGS